MVSIESLQGLFTGIIISAVVAILSSLFLNYFFQRLQYAHQLKLYEIESCHETDIVKKNKILKFLNEDKKNATIFLIAHFFLYAIVVIGLFILWNALFGVPTSLTTDNGTCINQTTTFQNITNINYYNVTVDEMKIDRKPVVMSVNELKYLVQKRQNIQF